jgi:hypothetical protein
VPLAAIVEESHRAKNTALLILLCHDFMIIFVIRVQPIYSSYAIESWLTTLLVDSKMLLNSQEEILVLSCPRIYHFDRL